MTNTQSHGVGVVSTPLRFAQPAMQKNARSRVTSVIAVIVVLVLTVLSAPAAHASDAPDELIEWLAEDGAAHVLASEGAPVADPGEIAFDVPTQVWTWSEGYLAGEPGTQIIQEINSWASMITVNEEVRGGIVVDMDQANSTTVKWSPLFGRATGAVTYSLVLDHATGGWFTLNDRSIRPVSDEAREVLAGPLDADQLQDYVRLWNGTLEVEESPVPETDGASTNIVFVTALGLVGILALVSIVVAFRKEGDLR